VATGSPFEAINTNRNLPVEPLRIANLAAISFPFVGMHWFDYSFAAPSSFLSASYLSPVQWRGSPFGAANCGSGAGRLKGRLPKRAPPLASLTLGGGSSHLPAADP
jgi:hypothetical protein